MDSRPTYLAGAIVQKVERTARDAFVLTVRLPRETVWLLVIAGTIGAIDKPAHEPADAFVQRLRKNLEGGRVVGVQPRADGARVVVRRGDEVFALVAAREGVTFVEGAEASGDFVEDGAPLALGAEQALARHLARLLSERRRALVAAIEAARKKLRRRVEAVGEDLSKIGRADEWQAMATLLVSNQHLLRRGMTEVVLDDWSSGEAVPRTLALDPSRSPKENIEALFHRARRLKKGRAIAEQRRAESERQLAALDALADEAKTGELDVVEARAKARGVRVAPPGKKQRAEEQARKPYTEFQVGERLVLVGRGAKDNDELTTKVARPWDLWLHAKGFPGAHVVVPLGKSESCPSELLVDAAHLAAHFSDARGEAVVEVQYTPRKWVRKPKGSAPGAVAIDREKVLVLRVEPGRLERLLKDQPG